MSSLPFQTAGDWLLRLREDKLSDAEMSRWIEWCEADPANLRAFEELQSLWRAAGASVLTPSSLVGEGALAQARAGEGWTSFKRWAVAASLILFIAGASFFLLSGPSRISPHGTVRTPIAQNKQATLPDGSEVTVGGRTELAIDFTAPRRQLSLHDGQAFFKVKHDRTRPFVVDAGPLRIEAIGTAFDVRRTPTQIAVTVEEGAVRVSHDSSSIVAAAGHQLTFNSLSGKLSKSAVNPQATLAWRSGRLEFTGDSLEVVIASVNRYSKRPVTLSDPALGKLSFTGTVFADSIDASLDAMQQVFPVTLIDDGIRGIVLAPRH